MKKQFMADFDFEIDEKQKTVAITEQGVAKAERFLGIDHLYRAENGHLVNHLIQSLRAQALYKTRRRLRGDRRRGQDHRRVHRAHPRRQALVGGPAPGGRGQGGRVDPGGEPDARDDHLPELLPPVRQARGHDRHGADGGDRVHEDLRAAGRADPDEHGDGPRRTATIRSTRPRRASGTRSSKRSPRATRTASRCSWARSRWRSQSSSASDSTKRGIKHTVLNAKPEHAALEAEIVAEAGQPGAVTIATNMAGRGVDIKLGGNPEHLARLQLAREGVDAEGHRGLRAAHGGDPARRSSARCRRTASG